MSRTTDTNPRSPVRLQDYSEYAETLVARSWQLINTLYTLLPLGHALAVPEERPPKSHSNKILSRAIR